MRCQPARRSNHRIRSAVPKPMMGLSAMAAFATNHDWVSSMCVPLFSICSRDMRSPSGARPVATPAAPASNGIGIRARERGFARAHVVIRELW